MARWWGATKTVSGGKKIKRRGYSHGARGGKKQEFQGNFFKMEPGKTGEKEG